ncbi:FAD-dependent oxidoreductase [Dactylosporangium sp. NPDC049525]|uniref:FAD-dependent oxidoreductase n=1 Tax=Dactylosporangium sp. NPDC049525 TaxID=3154730 RepID=UPI00343E8FE6
MTGRRIAIVGAGPAGLYALQALLTRPEVAGVDVFDRLPVPYGLVRYGVAADHPKTRAVVRVFHRLLADPRVRFLGNVTIGTHLQRDDLRAHYDAVVYATGARLDRDLGIAGETLPGSLGAAEFVSWYSGHPDAVPADALAGARSAVVIGAGNVALDVVRILGKDPASLRDTDMPDEVLAALSRSTLTDIHLLARRGPADARFSPLELRELGDVPDLDILVDRADLAADRAGLSGDAGRNLTLLDGLADRTPAGRGRRIHLHFWHRPIRIEGDGRVGAVVAEDPRTGTTVRYPADIVLRAIGYRAVPVPGLPFDDDRAIVPHTDGRIAPGEYVTGWLGRGPSGVIGTNRPDAVRAVASLVADLPTLPQRPGTAPSAVPALLAARGVPVVDWAGWLRIEAHEAQLGARRGTATVKLVDRARMLAIAAT